MKTRVMLLHLAVLLLIPQFTWAGDDCCKHLDRQDIRLSLEILASPALGGRGTGQDGFDAAGVFLARELRNAGFLPLPGSDDGYFIPFMFAQDIVAKEGNTLELMGDEVRSLSYETDFLPMLLGFNTGVAEGEIAFVGYGITAPDFSYDDYANIDVTGRIVVILRHEPRENGEDEEYFSGKKMTSHAAFTSKIKNAIEHGAIGVMFVQDVLNHDDRTFPIDLRAKRDNGRMQSIGTHRPYASGENASVMIPVISVSVAVADELLGDSIKSIQETIDQAKHPLSFTRDRGDIRMSTSKRILEHRSRNVVGYLPGKKSDEYVLIGAHYDHLGTHQDGAYLGADDNASGTAGVLQIARALGEMRRDGKKFRRNIVVGFWGAEEWRLQGSWYFAHSDLVPIDERLVYLNFDMIGRNENDELIIVGAKKNSEFPQRSPTLAKLLDEENAELENPFEIDLRQGEGLFMRSDGGSFFEASPEDKRLPILFFFSGLHKDYHKPTDTVEKINIEKIGNIACLGLRITLRIATSSIRPVYVSEVEEKPE